MCEHAFEFIQYSNDVWKIDFLDTSVQFLEKIVQILNGPTMRILDPEKSSI